MRGLFHTHLPTVVTQLPGLVVPLPGLVVPLPRLVTTSPGCSPLSTVAELGCSSAKPPPL